MLNLLTLFMPAAWIAVLAAITLQAWINIGLSIVGSLVAFGAANRMSKETECTVIFAFSTVGAGYVAWCISSFMPSTWQSPFDTLLLGGVVSLLIGTRKQTIWIAPAWMPRLSLLASGLTWLSFFWGIS